MLKTTYMKRLFSFIIVLCLIIFSGSAFGQDAAKAKNDKKGGLSIGGYDQSRKSKAPTRSVVINEEAEKADKSIEAEKSEIEEEKAEAPAPAPVIEAKEAPAARPDDKEKGKQGKTYGHNKVKSGKDTGSTRSEDAKSKQKSKNNPKPKGDK
jgi:hypothetical protein